MSLIHSKKNIKKKTCNFYENLIIFVKMTVHRQSNLKNNDVVAQLKKDEQYKQNSIIKTLI